MDFKRLTDKAKQALDERGGPERLKLEAERLKTIATGPGSASEKARAAGDVLKHAATRPGDTTRAGETTPPGGTTSPHDTATPPR